MIWACVSCVCLVSLLPWTFFLSRLSPLLSNCTIMSIIFKGFDAENMNVVGVIPRLILFRALSKRGSYSLMIESSAKSSLYNRFFKQVSGKDADGNLSQIKNVLTVSIVMQESMLSLPGQKWYQATLMLYVVSDKLYAVLVVPCFTYDISYAIPQVPQQASGL